MSDPFIHQHLDKPIGLDSDPQESAEWRDAFHAVLQVAGPDRVRELMDMLSALARNPAIGWQPARGTPYINSIAPSQQPSFPGDLAIEERLGRVWRDRGRRVALAAQSQAAFEGAVGLQVDRP